jgi:hypothetical protein
MMIGSPTIRCVRMSAACVSTSLRCRKKMYQGIRYEMPGMMRATSTVSARRRCFQRAIEYAAGSPTARPSKVQPAATTRLFHV